MNTKVLSPADGVLSATDFNLTDCLYIIQRDCTLQGTTISLPQRCILQFEGGSLDNGTINANYTKIVGNGWIFKENFQFLLKGRLNQHELLAEWFGVSQAADDNTAAINRALQACYATGVCKIVFNPGRFNVKGTVLIGDIPPEKKEDNYDARAYWDIQMCGSGKSVNKGTTFIMYDNAVFLVKMKNGTGAPRAGRFSDCSFDHADKNSDRPAYAIVVDFSFTYQIERCSFCNIERAIYLTGATYYTKVSGCTFESCTYGISSDKSASLYENDDGGVNNNMVDQCDFATCAHPIYIEEGHGWHIYDIDIEGNNGTCFLGSYNRLTNARIERNLDTEYWLHVIDGCTVNASIHANGGNPSWRIFVEGNNNDLDVSFWGFNPRAILSEGKSNRFKIINKTLTYQVPNYFVYDIDDEFTINGYSNKYNYEGENLIKAGSPPLDLTEEYAITYKDGKCYPITANLNSDMGMFNIRVDLEKIENDFYRTCKFYLQAPTEQVAAQSSYLVRFQDHIHIHKVNQWLALTTAINGNKEPWAAAGKADSRFFTYDEADTTRMYIVDCFAGTIPLYERPAFQQDEGKTLDPKNPDGSILLRNTYVNQIISTFCYKTTVPQVFTNKLGKRFYRNLAGELISDGKFLTSNSGTVMEDSLSGILSGLCDVTVEITSTKTLDSILFKATRADTSVNFTMEVLRTTGPQLTTYNKYGSIGLSNIEFPVVLWITKNS